jgi:hypothetical protein
MWQIWPGQMWPLTAAQEAAFVADLEARASKTTRHTRDDITALMSLLRCGCPLDAALQFAPGLRASTLLGAYRKIETKRSAAVESWARISENPTLAVWRSEHRSAGRILPVAIERLGSAAEDDASRPGAFAKAVAQVQRRIDDTVATAAAIESRCELVHPTMPQLGSLASTLFNPIGSCVYADPFYLPDRSASLSPARVADLLGEERR